MTKTIMVPTTVLETRQTQLIEYRDQVRERAVTVYEQVPVTTYDIIEEVICQ